MSGLIIFAVVLNILCMVIIAASIMSIKIIGKEYAFVVVALCMMAIAYALNTYLILK